MKLDNFIALVKGVLLNESTISSFENISFEISTIKRGSLFFAYNKEDIQEAIKNGAYVIVLEDDTHITDDEIAWISVNSLDLALRALLRFMIIEKELECFECNEIELKLAQNLITNSNFIALNGNEKSIFYQIQNLDNHSILLFCSKVTHPSIFANPLALPQIDGSNIEVIEQTLFETSFIYDDTYHERELLSPFFLSYLERVLHLLKSKNIEFKLKKFANLGHFEAVFVNKNLQIKNFGTSEMVLIFEPNTSLFKNQLSFIKQHAPWAQTIFIVPKTIPDRDSYIFTYEQKREILEILKRKKFHFALIVGCDKSLLDDTAPTQTQLSFDF